MINFDRVKFDKTDSQILVEMADKTKIVMLTSNDLRLEYRKGTIDPPPVDMLTHHDFNLPRDAYNQAAYVFYVTPSGDIKVLKQRRKIFQK